MSAIVRNVSLTFIPFNHGENFFLLITALRTVTETITREEPTQSVMVPTRTTHNSSQVDSSSHISHEQKTDVDLKVDIINFQDTIVDVIFLKQPCVNSTNKPSRKKRAISTSFEPRSQNSIALQENVRESQIVTSEPKPTKTDQSSKASQRKVIRFTGVNNVMQFNVSVSNEDKNNTFSYFIENLEHFSLYSVEIVACHGNMVSNETFKLLNYYQCSLQAITQVRTLPIEENDKILFETIQFQPANETFSDNIVRWAKPEKPNGEVLAYNVRYKSTSGGNQAFWSKCITPSMYERDNGFKISGITPGHYVLNVQAITMYSGSGDWSEPDLEFTIPNDGALSLVTIAIMVIIFFILAITIAAYATCYFQKQKNAANGLLYASVNPDYIRKFNNLFSYFTKYNSNPSTNMLLIIIFHAEYEADEWEVESNKLIIGPEIGKGSFGQVFKGQLITDKGPIDCAIKTVPASSTAKHRLDFLREASTMK